MKLLITGIPATRKTTLGNHLSRYHGFFHLDVEEMLSRGLPQELNGCDTWHDIAVRLAAMARPVVISWGFMPGADDAKIRLLQSYGYKLIWFDGNRDAARREFIKRGTVPVSLLDLQMERINNMDLSSLDPVIIDTFDDEGEVLPVEDVAALVLAQA